MPSNNRRYISSRIRSLVLARDNFKCRMCGRSSEEVSLVVDHIFPYDRGGTDDLNNLATLCRDCNLGKADLLIQNLLKRKVETGDFSPIEFARLDVSFKTQNRGDGLVHEYELCVVVDNKTGTSIKHPQLEIRLPAESLFIVTERGHRSREGLYSKVIFSNLDIDVIHTRRNVKIMETANVGIRYRVNSDIFDRPEIMNSDFDVTLLAQDMEPLTVKKRFSEMQEF